MKRIVLAGFVLWAFWVPAFLSAGPWDGQTAASRTPSELQSLLPQVAAWTLSEEFQSYYPESLFEYINGAAESYLGYNFQELLVAQYKRKEAGAPSLTIEVYDMGNPTQAFGIYGAERYPESRFLPAGAQGYYEEGALNFLADRYYIKLMCYECGPDSEKELLALANQMAAKAGGGAGLPSLLSVFPTEGLIANSEKFILRNFQGLGFLENGYQASYRVGGQEFEAFIVEAGGESRAADLLSRYLDHYRSGGLEVVAAGPGFTFRDKYLAVVFVAQAGPYLCGITRIKDGAVETGRAYLGRMVEALKKL